MVAIKPTAAQARALRSQKTSFGILFVRTTPIETVRDRHGEWVAARKPGKHGVLSVRRFATDKEAVRHARRFTRLHGHETFAVVALKQRPNAWVNARTGKTNPLIGKARL